MGSLRFCASQDNYSSERCNFLSNFNSYETNWGCSSLWVSVSRVGFALDRKDNGKGFSTGCCGLPCKTSGFNITSSVAGNGINRWNATRRHRFKQIVLHGLEVVGSHSVTETVEEFQSSQVGDAALVGASLALNNPVPNLIEIHKNDTGRASERKIWKRVASETKIAQAKVQRRVSTRKEKSFARKGKSFECSSGNEIEAALSTIVPESSIDHCNSVLKLLEQSSDRKAMDFFEWMKSNGKLKKNPAGYTLAIRVLARKEDWNSAMTLLHEMTSHSDCALNSKVFNALIYVCAKRGNVGWGTKWFHMMLEKGVQPNIATIGMLMGLYQKCGNRSHAEFTFGHMRNFKLHCVAAYSSMITIYTRLGMYDKSEEIIGLMEQDEVPPNLENWLVRLNAYCQQGKLEEAESVVKSMLDVGICPNIVAYNTLITGYGKVSNTNAAKLVFHSLQSAGLEPDETTFRSMVEGFGRTNNYKEALWYYEKLKNSGFRPSSSNFYTMINLQARHGDRKGAIRTLEDMREMGCQCSSILSSLLQAYERVGRTDDVPLILKYSLYDNILLDPTSCSILVMSYVQNSLMDDAIRVLQDKRWKDSKYEGNLYHLLICSCKEAGGLENAVKIYNQMPKSQSNPNLHITCSMIDIYSAMNRFTDAEDLFLKLKASGVTFDMITYSIAVRMYIKSGSLRNACLVLDMMEKQKDIVPDKFLFLDMLRVYQQCSMLEKLESLYYWILKTGITWDEAMYSCVINCCSRSLPVDELSRLFDEMIRCGYSANTVTFNVMLDVYGKSKLFKRANRVFWMARKQGLADVISYNTIIAAYGVSKNFKSMRNFVRRMQTAGHLVSLEAYNSMLDAYGKEDLLEEFNDVLQKMKEARCASDHYTYNIMINIYGKKGWIEDVARVLAELKGRGLEPDLYSYNTLINAYGIAGMPEDAVNVVKEMRLKGIEPDRITYSNLIVALQRNENFLEAVKWSLWMKQSGISS